MSESGSLSETAIRLRAPELGDVETLYSWENQPEVWDVGNALAPYSRKQLMDYVATYDGDIYASRQLRLMIAAEGMIDAIGTIDLFDFDPANSRCAIGIYIDTPFRNRGIAARAIELAEDYCSHTLSLHQLYATVAADNAASLSLFGKRGFAVSGRLDSWLRHDGKYKDALLLQKILV